MMLLYDFLQKILTFFSDGCYFRTHWRLYCPGCGGTRALLELVQGNIVQSLQYNPITIFFFLDVLVTTILCIVEKKCKKYSTATIRMIINSAFLIFIIIFSVARNYLLYRLGIDVLGDIK